MSYKCATTESPSGPGLDREVAIGKTFDYE